ncbi:MAG: hypothetical protein CMH41_08345 [Micrococcales bacterium]|jgi:hypothetical protein|nr:hypothetical protein [Micrococcales bacterium]
MSEQPWWHQNSGEDQQPLQDGVGSAAEEAARLFSAMRDRFLSDPATMRAGAKLLETFSTLQRSSGGVIPGEPSECAYCPVCQAMARAKSLNPESMERLTAAAVEFADNVRNIVGLPEEEDDDRVRHVPLDEDFEDWPEPTQATESVKADEPERNNPPGQ